MWFPVFGTDKTNVARNTRGIFSDEQAIHAYDVPSTSRTSAEELSTTASSHSSQNQVFRPSIPELLHDTARTTSTQRDLAALRTMGKVGRGSRVFGGDAAAKAGAEDDEGTMSLQCVGLLERYRKRQVDGDP